MTTNNLLLVITLLVTLLGCRINGEDKQVYIVYMGGSRGGGKDSVVSSYVSLLSSVLGSRKDAESSLVYSYIHAFAGFSAVMSKKQASAISEKAGIVSVFPDRLLKLHTTRTWDFLQSESGLPKPSYKTTGDSIIGMIDTGVWPESPSFNDHGIGPVPSRWKGACKGGPKFKCNRKIIGARYYSGTGNLGSAKDMAHPLSSRDDLGHGTHTASTAAGSVVTGANYYGLANGSARGGSPTSRIAVYRVCSKQGCQLSDLVAGLDDAINDGVDVISISIGSGFQTDFLQDPVAIAAFHATQKGILVVCSAGNEGAALYSVENSAPWILTVAATTLDRDLESDIILGNGKTLKGHGINFSNLSRSKMYPLVNAVDIALNNSDPTDASNCAPQTLDPGKAKGKILLCSSNNDYGYVESTKVGVQGAGAKGMVILNDSQTTVGYDYGTFPSTTLSDKDGSEILSYIRSHRTPVATILRSVTASNYKPAPVIARFSSRGPSQFTQSILKPDISAPGLNILAAWIALNKSADIPPGEKPSKFSLQTGTSMSAPHVSGAAALLKSVNPSWSTAAISSALITTATFTNNAGAPITDSYGKKASPLDMGSGEVNPTRALNPGLIYDTTIHDYLLFLCNWGYNTSVIHSVVGNRNFSCPSHATDAKISDINFPTIAIAALKSARTIKRTLTNIGSASGSVYKVTVDAPRGLGVKVSPSQLAFSRISEQVTYSVRFTPSNTTNKRYTFGAITWADGTHSVRTPFVVHIGDQDHSK